MKLKLLIALICLCSTVISCKENTQYSDVYEGIQNDEQVFDDDLDEIVFSDNQVAEVNLFVENSGSMLGYVLRGNEFDRAISSLLTEVKLQNLVSNDNIRMYYINSMAFEQKNVSIETFIKGMGIRNATTYKGHIGTTSMCALLDTVFSRTSDSTVSIFVSDCIISPGKNDASKFVGAEKDALKLLANRQCDENRAVVVYRLTSAFHGKFYNCVDKPEQIDTVRPFFIWVVGSKPIIEHYINKVPDNKIEGGVKNRYVFFNVPAKTPKYIVQSLTHGEKVDAHSVKKAKLDKESKDLRINVAIDFSSLKLLDKYLLDVDNYEVSNKFYQVEKVQKKAGVGTTHVVILKTTTPVSPTSITISLKNRLPEWVKQYSISADQCDEVFSQLEKTYAMEDIMQGMFQGYNNQSTCLISVKININK